MQGIEGSLTIDAGTGDANRLIVDDSTDVTARNVTVFASQIDGLAPAIISYAATDGSFANGPTNDGILILGSAAGSTYDIQSTLAGSTTRVAGGADADAFVVGSTVTGLSRVVSEIAGWLTISGEGGSDSLDVENTADTLGHAGSLTTTELTGLGMTGKIVYGTVEALKIGLGSGDDTFTVESTHSGTTELNTNGGGDTVNVRTIEGATTVNTGDDADTVNVGSLAPATGGDVNGIAALLTINGEG